MFCSNCGAQGQGNFCSNCGTRLAPAPAPSLEKAPTAPAPNLEKGAPAGPPGLENPASAPNLEKPAEAPPPQVAPGGFAPPPPPGQFAPPPQGQLAPPQFAPPQGQFAPPPGFAAPAGFAPPPAGAFAFQPPPFPVQPPPLPADWSQEIRCEVLMRHPEVRALISRHAAGAGSYMTAEQFLQLCDKLALTQGVPLTAIASFSQRFSESLGIKTGKSRSEEIPRPAGRVLVGALCSLAKRAQPLKKVEQAEDGCMLVAEMPSSMWAMAGTLTVTVRRSPKGAAVEASTYIGGQWYDWGKSNRVLSTLFEDIRELAGA